MSNAVTFTVNNDMTLPVDENVLVFLMPVNASPDFQFAAWQSLNIAPGGSQPFIYEIDIQVQAQRMDNLSTSARTTINPGEIWDCVLSNEGGLTLVREDPTTGPNAGAVTPEQSAVCNSVAPQPPNDMPIDIQTIWLVNGSEVVMMPNLNEQSLSIFQLEPSLFFRAAAPTQQGFNYTLQQVSQATTYYLPSDATQVSVTWARSSNIDGPDTFTFDPPSAPPPA